MRPLASKAEVRFYFDLMDRDRNGKIDTFDFLDMREILQLRMHQFHEYMLPHNHIKQLGSRILTWQHFQNVMVSECRVALHDLEQMSGGCLSHLEAR